MRRAAIFVCAMLVVLALGGSGCGSKNLHVVHTETWSVPDVTVRDCTAARELLDADAPVWRFPAYHTRYGDRYVQLTPTDELWIVEVEDGYGRPFGEHEGFDAVVRCGKRSYELELLECSMEEGRRLFIPAHQLPAAGSVSRPCSLRLGMRHGEHEWFDASYSLVLRPGLGRWRDAPPHTPSSR